MRRIKTRTFTGTTYTAVSEREKLGMEIARDAAAAGCMRAGNDVVMPGCENDQVNLSTELASGSLKKADLEACVSRLVRCVLQSNEYVIG